MSRKGNCWDNAPMESFFGSLKTELEIELSLPPVTRPNGICLPIWKDITIACAYTRPWATLHPTRPSDGPHNPVSIFSGKGHAPTDGVRWT
jgi:transposase InsO family protein